MNEGYEHTSGDQVNIQNKLCVHPTIISNGTKTWIKRSLRVVTWLGYKRKDICGTFEFKWPSIREHSFYSHSKDTFTRIPLILNKPLVFNHDTPWSWQLILFLNFSFFFYFSLFLFLYHVYTFSFLFFFFVFITQCCLDQKIKIHHFTWQMICIYLFLPNLNKTYHIRMFLYSMAKGQINMKV